MEEPPGTHRGWRGGVNRFPVVDVPLDGVCYRIPVGAPGDAGRGPGTVLADAVPAMVSNGTSGAFASTEPVS